MVIVVAAVLLATGGPSDSPAEDDSPAAHPAGPNDAEAELRPERMVAEPSVAQPGSTVEIHYPDGAGRGMLFALERETESGWQMRYFLASDAGRDYLEPAWWTPDSDEGHAILDVELGGQGPDLLPVPDSAPPGYYRICTANNRDNFCTRLVISDDGLACDTELRESAAIDYEPDPEPAGATAVAAAETQLADEFGAEVAFQQTGPTAVEALNSEGNVVGTVTVLEVPGGFVVEGFTKCG